jgi:hypothetical protein
MILAGEGPTLQELGGASGAINSGKLNLTLPLSIIGSYLDSGIGQISFQQNGAHFVAAKNMDYVEGIIYSSSATTWKGIALAAGYNYCCTISGIDNALILHSFEEIRDHGFIWYWNQS